MKELNMAWELLKMGEDYGDVSVALDRRAEEERARKDAIERQNAMARKRLMEQAQLPKKKDKIKFPNLMTDSPERIRELAPNANLVDGNAPPVPQTDPNPLGLSMDKLKELQRQG